MSQDSKTKRTDYATLWQTLCWLAYDDFGAHEPPGGRNVREELILAFNTSGHKRALLQAAREGRVHFEGLLGMRVDPPASPSDTWEQFHWAAHSSAFSKIELTDWPAETDNEVIDWQNSGLRTPRGEFLDIRALRADVQCWYPGPRGQQQSRADEPRSQATDDKPIELADATATGTPKVHPYLTGLAGRPTIKHLILAEFRKRAKGHTFDLTLADEATALCNWAEEKHPDGARPTRLTIENLIRNEHRRAKAAIPQNTPQNTPQN